MTRTNKNVVPLSFIETQGSKKASEEKKSGSSSALSPPALLVHGLDSSSHTWCKLLDDLASTGFGAVAVDQRGCGKSPLGDPERFSPDALVDDLYNLVTTHALFSSSSGVIEPFVLVGHSMGGRIAMSFAEKHPELIAALIIEDMDVRKRSLSTSHVRSPDRTATIAFDRNLAGISTPDGVVAAFATEGYPGSQVEKWLSEGRVTRTESGDGYYSQVNPAFRLLCYEQFFETNHGEETWEKLASVKREFPIHVMIADPTLTICDEASITIMKDAMEKNTASNSPSPNLYIHRYSGATHSIHNSNPEEFTKDLKAIIERAHNKG